METYYVIPTSVPRKPDEPEFVTDTGFTHFGRRILIEGDNTNALRFQWEIERNYPLLANKRRGTDTNRKD